MEREDKIKTNDALAYADTVGVREAFVLQGSAVSSLEEQLVREETLERLDRLMQDVLAPRVREAVLCTYFSDSAMSMADVAEEMGVTKGTVSTYLTQAKLTLTNALAREPELLHDLGFPVPRILIDRFEP